MADRRRRSPEILLEYAFDRLSASKLERAYTILVPDLARLLGGLSELSGDIYEDCGNLRPSILGTTERSEHDCEPNGGVGGIRSEPRVRRTG
jgi:hypothetical protein